MFQKHLRQLFHVTELVSFVSILKKFYISIVLYNIKVVLLDSKVTRCKH